ncbi:MAG: GYD domain-containing protein [Acidimicrobiales bacterium]
MGKYLIRGNYVGDGVAGLIKEGGSSRREAATAAIESVGGSMDCMYYAFGDTDVFAICDFPDTASATACSLMINSSGGVNVSMTPLMTPEDVDDATKMAPMYRAPGS